MIDTALENGAGVFVLALTSNPEGPSVQHARTADGERSRPHLFERSVAVRAVGGVGDVEEVLSGQGPPDLAGDAETAHP